MTKNLFTSNVTYSVNIQVKNENIKLVAAHLETTTFGTQLIDS